MEIIKTMNQIIIKREFKELKVFFGFYKSRGLILSSTQNFLGKCICRKNVFMPKNDEAYRQYAKNIYDIVDIKIVDNINENIIISNGNIVNVAPLRVMKSEVFVPGTFRFKSFYKILVAYRNFVEEVFGNSEIKITYDKKDILRQLDELNNKKIQYDYFKLDELNPIDYIRKVNIVMNIR